MDIKRFAWYGFAVVASLAVAMALLISTPGTVHADISTLEASDADDSIPALTSDTLTATFDAEPANGETVTFQILTSSTATGALGDALAQSVTCTLAAAVNGLSVGDCDDGTAEVDIVNETVTAVTITVTAYTSGTLNLLAIHEGGAATEALTVTSAAGAASSLALTGPASITNAGDGVNVTAVATDASGNRIAVSNIQMTSVRGTLAQDAGAVVNDCVPIADDDDGATGNDTTCVLDTTTSTTTPGRVGVYENGNVGETVRVTGFFTASDGSPIVAVHQMTIVGVAAAATVVAEDTAAGGTSTITVTALDANGNPVGEDTDVTVAASAGTVAACSNGTGATGNTRSGVVTCTYVAPTTPQEVVITAVVDVPTGTDLVVTDTLMVGTGVQPTPTPPPAGGEGTFDRPISNVGVNTAVWNGGTVTQLSAATSAAGGISVTVFVGGQAKVLIPGAPAFVNAAFNAVFPTGVVPAGTIVLVVR